MISDYCVYVENHIHPEVCDNIIDLFKSQYWRHERFEKNNRPRFTQFNFTQNKNVNGELHDICCRYALDAVELYSNKVKGFKEPSSKRVKEIIESDLNDLKAAILSDERMLKAMPGNVDPEVITKVMIPKIIQSKYPQLSENEVEELRDHFVMDSTIKRSQIKEVGGKRFLRMADKFINIDGHLT